LSSRMRELLMVDESVTGYSWSRYRETTIDEVDGWSESSWAFRSEVKKVGQMCPKFVRSLRILPWHITAEQWSWSSGMSWGWFDSLGSQGIRASAMSHSCWESVEWYPRNNIVRDLYSCELPQPTISLTSFLCVCVCKTRARVLMHRVVMVGRSESSYHLFS
jgi:hypothetical protein